jgi:hypothetical protein
MQRETKFREKGQAMVKCKDKENDEKTDTAQESSLSVVNTICQ